MFKSEVHAFLVLCVVRVACFEPHVVTDSWIPLGQAAVRPLLSGSSALGLDAEVEANDGAICPTFLHPDIQTQNLKPFLKGAGADPDAFVAETQRLCGATDTSSYTGSWKDIEPTKNDVRVARALADWSKKQRESGSAEKKTWKQYAKADAGRRTAKLVRHISENPEPIKASGLKRALDFGCGSGDDIVAVKKEFNLTAQDTLCADVFYVDRHDLTPIVLNASTPEAYKASLDKGLEGNKGTVHFVISMVTFHHIADPKMRLDALTFIKDVLTPGGIAIISDWDNSLAPSRWIQFDMVHWLPAMLWSNAAPSRPEYLKIGTEYLSIDQWLGHAKSCNLNYEEERSKFAKDKAGNKLGPRRVANLTGNANRDFTIVLS